MRIMWGSNAPFVASGYAVQTALLLPHLLRAGHDVSVACNYGLDEGTIGWQTPYGTVGLLPKGPEEYSTQILDTHAEFFQADVLMTHFDSWVYDPTKFKRPWVPWFPIDTEEATGGVADRARQAAMRITQTHHAVAALHDIGLDAEYVPAAYDTECYHPHDPTEWREQLNIPLDRFVIAVVAANSGAPGQPSRKSYPQILTGFKQFLADDPDALLYIHAHMNHHLNLDYLIQTIGIPRRNIAAANGYFLHTAAYAPSWMASMYSGADVLLQPSMGEGFGVPIIESQACGTPVIVGDWTAMSEVCKTGIRISKDSAYRYSIVSHGDQWMVEPSAIRDALIEARGWKHDPAEVSARVAEYEIRRVWDECWVPALAKVEELIAPKLKAVS